jgi:ATP-binding cassette subfamily B protein
VTEATAEEPETRAYDAALAHRLLQYLHPYRWPTILAVVLLLLLSALALVPPALTQRALDVAVPHRDIGLLATLAGLYGTTLVLEFTLEWSSSVLTTWIGQGVMADLREQLFGHLQRLSIPFFDRNPVGRLMTRVTSDVETLNEVFTSGIVTVFGDCFTLVAIMAMMLYTDWRLALVAFGVIPFVILVAAYFREGTRTAFRDIRLRLARLNSYLQEQLSGMRVIQLFGREARSAQGFAAINQEHLEAHLRSITVYALFFPAIELLTAVALAALLWYGGLRAAGTGLTIGVLAAFIQLTRRFFQPLQDLSEKYNLLQSAMASSERIFGLLDEPITVPEPVTPRALPEPLRGEVTFEGVWFAYGRDGQGGQDGRDGRVDPDDRGDWVLKDVSFVARPGETLALVGHTGAGKTTIINLLLRYYQPQRGRITIDGVDIRELASADLRGAIGFVQQDLFLFSGDILRNLRLDAPVPESAALGAARRVGADRFISRLPGGYAHELSERGRNLSVGERQLLSFARALTLDPRILVLDEATSSVDAEAEAQIQAALAELMQGRTSVVVAHRLSTILHADQILVLHHGEIRQRGTHRELLARDGLYQRLYRLQFGQSGAA